MRIVHQLTKPGISKKTDGTNAFCLVNGRQDFVNFYASTQSRYEGFYVKTKTGFLKLVSSISVNQEPEEIRDLNMFSVVARKYKGFSESFFLVKNEPVLVYEVSKKAKFTVRLDVREIFKNPEWGRNYEILKAEKGVVVKYWEEGQEASFVAFLTDGTVYKTLEWKKMGYPRDVLRNSKPSFLYEFELGHFESTKLVVAYATSYEESVKKAESHFNANKISLVKDDKPVAVKGDDKMAVKTAVYGSKKTLAELFSKDGLYAGLPWFTSAWSRDELLSLPALPEEQAKKILQKYLKVEWPQGKIPVIIGGEFLSSDALGILCWAVMVSGVKLSVDEKIKLADKLLKAVQDLEQNENELGFVYSDSSQSWMDSIKREGYLVEIQALYSKILQLAYFLTHDEKYDKKRTALIKNIRMYFFYGKDLMADRIGDAALRPNIFLAAFFAPEILTKDEWQKCFDRALPELWLSWGGLASVSKKSDLFVSFSTGENNLSYHNGDSWFFVNNIAAIVMRNFGKLKYRKYIVKILAASTEEILWHNFIGRPGEISSAEELESWGCGAQAFSASTYLYLAEGLDINKNAFDKTKAVRAGVTAYVF